MGNGTDSGDFSPGKRAIMEATYNAVSKTGYSELTIQDIAEEFERSKTLIYYHYDGRDELLVDFLDFILAEFLEDLPEQTDSPREELVHLIDLLLPTTVDEEPYRVMLAMFELRINAPHDEESRQQYQVVEQELESLLEDILRRGVQAGQFTEMDVSVEAEALLSLLIGTRTRRLTVYEPEESIEPLKRAIDAHIDRILAPESDPNIVSGGN